MTSGILDNFVLLNTIINSIWYVFTIIFILYKFTSFFTTAWGVIKFTGKLFYGAKYICTNVYSYFYSKINSYKTFDLESQNLNPNNQNNIPNYGSHNNTEHVALETIYESKITDIDIPNNIKHGTHSSDSQLLEKYSLFNPFNHYYNYRSEIDLMDKEKPDLMDKEKADLMDKKLNFEKEDDDVRDKTFEIEESGFRSVYPETNNLPRNTLNETDSELLLESQFINQKLFKDKVKLKQHNNNNEHRQQLEEQNKNKLIVENEKNINTLLSEKKVKINKKIILPFAQNQ